MIRAARREARRLACARGLIAAIACTAALARADGAATPPARRPVFDRARSELSPGRAAPAASEVHSVLQHAEDAPAALELLLERAERVECGGCVPPAEELLTSTLPRSTRLAVARWLRHRPFALEGVVERLGSVLALHADPATRLAAAEALGELRDERALPPLVRAAGGEVDGAARAAAVAALGRLGHGGSRDALAAALDDADARVRRAAVAAVRDAGHTTLDDAVRAAVGDSDPIVRRRACLLVARRGVAAAGPALTALLTDDPEPDVRVAAAWALGRLGASREALEALLDDEEDERVLDAILVALAMLD